MHHNILKGVKYSLGIDGPCFYSYSL